MTLLMLAIGFMAQLFFSARVLIQWLMSEKNHKVLSPTIFWFLSLAGSFLLFVYGWMRNDFAIIMGQMIAYYIYIGNLKLKDAWSKIPLALRYFLLLIPLAALIATLSDFSRFIELFFKNEDIPLWLLTIGITGQIIFTCRFIYQWLYSKRQNESMLPTGFWWISLTGSVIICCYALLRYDPVLILGQSLGLISYIRNLMIGHKNKKTEEVEEV